MHVAFVAPALAGHLDPLRAVARELVRRGHRATLVARVDAREAWRGPGFDFASVGLARQPAGSLEASIAALTRRGPLALPAMLREVARGTDVLCEEAPRALREIGAEFVVADQAEAAGAWVAAAAGVPWVTVASALPLERDPDVPPPWRAWMPDRSEGGRRRNRVRWAISDALMRPIDRVLATHSARIGIAPVGARGPRAVDATLTQLVPSIDFPRSGPRAALRHLGPWREPRDAGRDHGLPLDLVRPTAFCSLGTMQAGRGALLARVARACDELGLALVVAHAGRLDARDAAALPGAPIVRDFVRQRALLPHCAVAIVHGGLNTVLDAMASAVPLVVMPLGFEQPGTAARLRRAGVAEIASPRASVESLRASIDRVLDGPHRACARAVAAEIAASGGARAAADAIETSARESSSRGRLERAPRNRSTR